MIALHNHKFLHYKASIVSFLISLRFWFVNVLKYLHICYSRICFLCKCEKTHVKRARKISIMVHSVCLCIQRKGSLTFILFFCLPLNLLRKWKCKKKIKAKCAFWSCCVYAEFSVLHCLLHQNYFFTSKCLWVQHLIMT